MNKAEVVALLESAVKDEDRLLGVVSEFQDAVWNQELQVDSLEEEILLDLAYALENLLSNDEPESGDKQKALGGVREALEKIAAVGT